MEKKLLSIHCDVYSTVAIPLDATMYVFTLLLDLEDIAWIKIYNSINPKKTGLFWRLVRLGGGGGGMMAPPP